MIAKVLIVDDSIAFRHLMSQVIEKIPEAKCVGTAASGEIALRKAKECSPDLVLLDMIMPGWDGTKTLEHLKEACPEIQVIMVSGYDFSTDDKISRILEIGVLEVLPKPVTKNVDETISHFKRNLTPLVQLVITKKYAAISRHDTDKSSIEKKKKKEPISIQKKFDLVIIGISTGGPDALEKLMPNIIPSISCPILIVQHMPPVFTRCLAEKLQSKTALNVTEAQDGFYPQAGCVYIAQGGLHLQARRKDGGKKIYLELEESAPVNNCRPSVDVLCRSVAETFTGNVLAVIMTGMGRDGTDGIRILKNNGNTMCLIQDKISSVIWGMPGSIYEAGLADEIVPLRKLGQRISELAR